jgi:hypothetical protein
MARRLKTTQQLHVVRRSFVGWPAVRKTTQQLHVVRRSFVGWPAVRQKARVLKRTQTVIENHSRLEPVARKGNLTQMSWEERGSCRLTIETASSAARSETHRFGFVTTSSSAGAPGGGGELVALSDKVSAPLISSTGRSSPMKVDDARGREVRSISSNPGGGPSGGVGGDSSGGVGSGESESMSLCI